MLITLTAAFVPIYKRLALKINLVDIPNRRSSHQNSTLKGAGIVIVFAFLLGQLILDEILVALSIGALIGAITGLVDDKTELHPLPRAISYSVAVAFVATAALKYSDQHSWLVIMLGFIIAIGTVNAFNFMDGINGISALYSLVLLATVWFINHSLGYELHVEVLHSCTIGLIAFSYLNVRKKAIAFLGDVGSVFLGLIAVYWVLLLINLESSFIFLSLLLVYGTDSAITIMERLIRRENIFKAHRRHLYQLLGNEMQWSHIQVSILYAIVQLLINAIMLYNLLQNNFGNHVFVIMALTLGLIYVLVKFLVIYPRIAMKK